MREDFDDMNDNREGSSSTPRDFKDAWGSSFALAHEWSISAICDPHRLGIGAGATDRRKLATLKRAKHSIQPEVVRVWGVAHRVAHLSSIEDIHLR